MDIESILHINNEDILDGTPLLDIKPYTAKFDQIDTTRNNWQDAVDEETARQRGRRGYLSVTTKPSNGDAS